MKQHVARFHAAEEALRHLRGARNILRRAGAHRAADAVRRAMKSAEGAKRHAEGLAIREAIAADRAEVSP